MASGWHGSVPANKKGGPNGKSGKKDKKWKMKQPKQGESGKKVVTIFRKKVPYYWCSQHGK